MPPKREFTAKIPDAPLCRADYIEEGRSRGFDPLGEGRDTMFIVRRNGQLFAWRNHCPHYENKARMAWRKDEFLNGDANKILCAAHGALFEIDSGECVLGPCLGQHLKPVAVEVRDGSVWVTEVFEPGFWIKSPATASWR